VTGGRDAAFATTAGGSATATFDDGTSEVEVSASGRAAGSRGAEGGALLSPRRRRTGSYVSSRPTQKWCFRIVGSATTVMTGSTNSSAGCTWQQFGGRRNFSAKRAAASASLAWGERRVSASYQRSPSFIMPFHTARKLTGRRSTGA
jgi:hypothetical protein